MKTDQTVILSEIATVDIYCIDFQCFSTVYVHVCLQEGVTIHISFSLEFSYMAMS